MSAIFPASLLTALVLSFGTLRVPWERAERRTTISNSARLEHRSICAYPRRICTFGASQFSILARLKRRGPLTINALADDMVMERTTLGRAIKPLERDGLISIESSPSDRRAKEVHLTKVGEKCLQGGNEAWAKAQGHFEASFGTERAVELRTLLRAVVASQFTPTPQFAGL